MPFVRSLLLAAVFALFSAGMTSGAPLSTYSKESVQSGAGFVLKVQGRCESLRRACANKGALGEMGEGNCRRYREECSGRSASFARACVKLAFIRGSAVRPEKAIAAVIAKSAEDKTVEITSGSPSIEAGQRPKSACGGE